MHTGNYFNVSRFRIEITTRSILLNIGYRNFEDEELITIVKYSWTLVGGNYFCRKFR